ncbi:hypothetical protein LCGC14_1584650 [marine sediment metagenome]|uniref:C2H2-type domain-containing protein n=1 Tax=marine sediment metagenome TaxID=412755 RepID=A0A0F9IFZ8_9ZZZZ
MRQTVSYRKVQPGRLIRVPASISRFLKGTPKDVKNPAYNRGVDYVCPTCEEIFPSRRSLLRHAKNAHGVR